MPDVSDPGSSMITEARTTRLVLREPDATVPERAIEERETELEALDDAIGSAAAGGGRLVVIEGPPGCGRSALLGWASELAAERGLLTLAARGVELEHDFGFGVVLQLLRPLMALAEADRDALLQGDAAAASSLFDGSLEHHDDATASHMFTYALGRLLEHARVSADAPAALIVVDDLQWADLPSLRFVAHLMARIEQLAVSIVVSLRSGDVVPHGRVVKRIRHHAGAVVLHPAPLSEAAVERLVHGHHPDAGQAWSASCLQRVTAGNPFLLSELIAELGSRAENADDDLAATLVPISVSRALRARLDRLPAEAAALAQSAAVLGEGAPLHLSGKLAGLEAEQWAAAAEALLATGVLRSVEPVAFTAPLVAIALLDQLSPVARARAHRQAADLLHEGGAPIADVATHLLEVLPARDRWVARALCAAADEAIAARDAPRAAQLLERAGGEPPEEAERERIALALALAQAECDEPQAIARLEAALEQQISRAERIQTGTTLVGLYIARAEFRTAVATADRALSLVGPSDPAVAGLKAGRLLASALLPEHSERVAAEIRTLAAEKAPTRLEVCAVLACSAAGRGARPNELRAIVRRCGGAVTERSGPGHEVAAGLLTAGLLSVDEFGLAEWINLAAEDRGRRRESAVARGHASLWQAWLWLARGDLPRAVSQAESSLEMADAGWTGWEGWACAALALAQVERGDAQGAHAALERASAVPAQQIECGFLQHARGRLAQLEADPARALALNLDAGRQLDGYGAAALALIPWQSHASLAALGSGDADQARALAVDALARASASGAPRGLALALRAVALSGPADRAELLLERALTALKGTQFALDRAYVLAELGALRRRLGAAIAAREPLRSAVEAARACGATPLAAHARLELAATGARTRRFASSGTEALTPSERRTARLAASGMSNAAIAQALFVTTKTVEWHLTRAYRKLGVKTRGELGDALAEASTGPAEDWFMAEEDARAVRASRGEAELA